MTDDERDALLLEIVQRLDRIDERLDRMERRQNSLEHRIVGVEVEQRAQRGQLNRMGESIATLDGRVHRLGESVATLKELVAVLSDQLEDVQRRMITQDGLEAFMRATFGQLLSEHRIQEGVRAMKEASG